jgi:hypothetical protein
MTEKFFCWACDYSKNSGEGNLANLFINNEFKKNYTIYTPKKLNINNHFIKSFINYKYISPFVGIFFCWFFFFKKKKILYINYLPFWNCAIFALLPPKTLLGPITGGANIGNKQIVLRKYIFPILYKISEIFIIYRKTNIYFSTDLLKKYLSKKIINKAKFNYVYNYLKKIKKNKKNIDFLIYYRKHVNKESNFPYDFLKRLISLNFKVHIFGDFFNNNSVKNYGYINNEKVNKLLSKTFFSLASNENPYTMFSLECINNHVKILIDKSRENNIKYYKKNFIFIDFKEIDSFKKNFKFKILYKLN